MAKFYIVVQETEDYSLITVEDGNYLEDIDMLTNKFANKEEFIDYLKDKGHSFSKNADLFIVNKGRKELYHRELIYGNQELADLAKQSKKGSINVTDNMNKLLTAAQSSSGLRTLMRKDYFVLYGDLKDMILNAKRNWLTINSKRNWMRNSYFVGRDAIATIDIFNKVKDQTNDGKYEYLVEKKKTLLRKRKELDKLLDKKINCENEQLNIFGEPKEYINLTYVNTEKLAEDEPKKVVRTKKTGLINEKMLDKLTVPYEVVTDDIDYSLANNIAQCIINLPYQKIKWGKRDRYEVDFKKWTKYTGIECNDYDAKFLNSLLETSLRQNSYWRSFYNNKENPTPAILSEKRRYQKSVYNTLLNAAKNKNDTYKKAYNFYLIYQAMINYDKDNNRGGYGK